MILVLGNTSSSSYTSGQLKWKCIILILMSLSNVTNTITNPSQLLQYSHACSVPPSFLPNPSSHRHRLGSQPMVLTLTSSRPTVPQSQNKEIKMRDETRTAGIVESFDWTYSSKSVKYMHYVFWDFLVSINPKIYPYFGRGIRIYFRILMTLKTPEHITNIFHPFP
jgi:hypothetical protein